MRRTYTKYPGFTLVEVIVVTVLVGIAITLLYGVLDSFYGSTQKTLNNATQQQGLNDSLALIERDVSLAQGFSSTTPITDPAYVSTGGSTTWSYKGQGASARTLIVQRLATTSYDTNRSLVYLPSPTNGCNTSTLSSNPRLVYYSVYYVNASQLWRRTVVPDNVTTPRCPGYDPIQKQTCPVGTTAAYCQGTDAKIAQDVTSFAVDYYTNSNDVTPVAVYDNPSALDATISTVKLTLTTKKANQDSANSFTLSLRITKQ